MSTRTLLVDADIPIFQIASACEVATDWGEGIWTLHSEEGEAIRRFDNWMFDLMEDMDADELILAVSDAHNFRKDVLPTYKHNRVKKRPPLLRKFLTEYALENYKCFQRPGLEGDDVLGILSTSKQIVKGEKIVVSIDKDLKTIPGKILNWTHGRHNVEAGVCESLSDSIATVSVEQADYFHLMQTLAGDTTDGYSGCPGVGLTTADNILSSEPHIVVPVDHEIQRGKRKGEIEKRWVEQLGDYTPWETIVSYFAKAGLGEEEALVQARVARICRNTEYNFKKKEVKLWKP